jgi:hypothetical protein
MFERRIYAHVIGQLLEVLLLRLDLLPELEELLLLGLADKHLLLGALAFLEGIPGPEVGLVSWDVLGWQWMT